LLGCGDSVVTTPGTADAAHPIDAAVVDAAPGDADVVDGVPADAALALPIEIAGTWMSNFGFTETISSDAWGVTAVIKYDNSQNVAITQSPPDDMFNPDKFNKIVWTEIAGDQFYYCYVDYGRDTAEDAENTTNTADATDPENGGCGGFAWTRMNAL
jgi:hypothetical protein